MSIRLALFCFIGLFTSSWAWAAAIVQSASGNVRVEAATGSGPLSVNQRVESGATVNTGADGHAVLRFDDGQMAALNPDTTFKIDRYHFEAAKPEQGSIAVSLLKGALRMVTGLIGERNRDNFSLRTPTATIGIRGTDFMVALVNPVYMTVVTGTITATTTAGTVAFGAGMTGIVASSTVLATSLAASALPASVSASFSQLGSLSMTGAAGASGASGASSGASGASSSAGASASGGASSAAGAGGAAGAGAGAGAAGATAAAAGGITAGAVAAGAVVAGTVVGTTSNQTTTGTTGTGTTGTTGTGAK